MTKKSEKENDRIQISAFWLSERQSPYVYNFLKKNASTHRGEQIAIIRSAITTGLVLNNLFPDLSSFINGLNERLTSADLNRFFNLEFEKNEFANEKLTEQISLILDSKFQEYFSKLNSCDFQKVIPLTNAQPGSSKEYEEKSAKDQRLESIATVLTKNPIPEPWEVLTPTESSEKMDSETNTIDVFAPDRVLQSDNKELIDHAQNQGVSRKPKKKPNVNLANLAK